MAKHPQPGTKVTPKNPIRPYYYGCVGHPKRLATPGDVFVVRSVNIPPVTGNRSNFFTAVATIDGESYTVALRPGEFRLV